MKLANKGFNKYFNNNFIFRFSSKFQCMVLGHNFELKTITKGEIPFHVYECSNCGLMSFKTCTIPESHKQLNKNIMIMILCISIILSFFYQIIRILMVFLEI